MELLSFATVLDLAIFAEIYIICQLKNQTSDILRTELGSGRWQLTPENVCVIYDEVPLGSILRELCSASLALQVLDPPAPSTWDFSDAPTVTHRKYENYLEWRSVFEKHSDLGWDYFKQIQAGNSSMVVTNGGGACRFHDHRDIPGTRREDVAKCPYPHGALPTEQSTRSPLNEYQHGVSMDAQLVRVGVKEDSQPVLGELPILDEDARVPEDLQVSEKELQLVQEVPL